MSRIAVVALTLSAASGCIIFNDQPDTVIIDDDTGGVIVTPRNAAPYVYDAYAGCYYDPYNVDDIWFFDAWVDDPDGVYDVVQVWADVYDDYTGQLVQSFELYPTDNAAEWYSDWLASTTWLDCWYNGYSVDLIAYDALDAAGGTTVWPATY
ncbi:MAG TPA: hypothetical protein PKA64_09450 [Myxococcota bacterium]|nr:hypothetical protein [Myxococcota bacterium]